MSDYSPRKGGVEFMLEFLSNVIVPVHSLTCAYVRALAHSDFACVAAAEASCAVGGSEDKEVCSEARARESK